MAKARIVYKVDDKELKALDKELKDIQGENKKVAEGFKDSNEEIKKSKSSLADLKGAVASIGLAAVATGAIVEFAKLTQEVVKNRKEVALLTNQTGLALDNITAKLRATSKVFDKDFNEILRAANTVSKEFGISMTAALDEINQGFSRGLDVNGEYLDTLKEYSTFIKEAGLNTRQFNVLIQKQAQQGIFSDKGIDAIKEAVLSIREMTPVTRDAIKGVGIDTNKMISDIQSGTTTYFEAVQQIATKTREIADPIKTGAILADVFKGAGEDAGSFIFTLDDVGDSFSEVSEEQQNYIDKQLQLLKSSENVNRELVQFSANFKSATTNLAILTNNISTASLQVLNQFLGLFVSMNAELDNFEKNIKDASVAQLEEELKRLEEGPTFFEKLGAAFGGAGGLGELAIESSTKVAILRDKIEELKEEEIVEANASEIAKNNTEALAKARRDQATATEKATKAEKERGKIGKESLKDLKINLAKEEQEELRILDEEFSQTVAEKEIEDQISLNNEIFDINQQARAKEKEAKDKEDEEDDKRREQKKELILGFAQGTADIISQFADLRIQQIGVELQAVELARNRELELAAGNKEQEAIINKKFDDQAAALKEKQAQAQKRSSIFQAVVATAVAVAQALPNVPLSVLAGILGAAQVAFIAAQPVPKFAKGVLGLQGNGTGTSDSIPAMLSKGESVITAAETSDYLPTLQAIRNREISPDILNNISMHRDTQPTIVVNDYDKLAKAVKGRPQKNLIADENGFTGYIISQSMLIKKKQSKYKM